MRFIILSLKAVPMSKTLSKTIIPDDETSKDEESFVDRNINLKKFHKNFLDV